VELTMGGGLSHGARQFDTGEEFSVGLSSRVATRRKYFSIVKKRSMLLRSLWSVNAALAPRLWI
jgi:hypothetical protein